MEYHRDRLGQPGLALQQSSLWPEDLHQRCLTATVAEAMLVLRPLPADAPRRLVRAKEAIPQLRSVYGRTPLAEIAFRETGVVFLLQSGSHLSGGGHLGGQGRYKARRGNYPAASAEWHIVSIQASLSALILFPL